jgi:ribonuclease P protein component
MAMKVSVNQQFHLLKRGLGHALTDDIEAKATKYAISDASRLGISRAKKYLKGTFPLEIIKRRLRSYMRTKERGTYGVDIWLGTGGVDLQYLEPHKQGRGIVANGHYYASAFFKKNAIDRKVWLRKWNSRKEVDKESYSHLWKVRQWFPEADEVDDSLLGILNEMEDVFLDRFRYHLMRLNTTFKEILVSRFG